MTDTPLETLRRQIREAEERWKREDAQKLQSKPATWERRSQSFAETAYRRHFPEPADKSQDQLKYLQKSFQALKVFIDTLIGQETIPVYILSPDGSIMEANLAACKWLGMEVTELLSKQLRDYVSPSSLKDYDLLFKRALQLQPAAKARCGFHSRTGSDINARISFAGICDASGVVNQVISILERLEAERPILEARAFGARTGT